MILFPENFYIIAEDRQIDNLVSNIFNQMLRNLS